MQNLLLSIPEPCHESWQQMTPTDQGRFCNACAKEVIDFSTMTDTEVLNYFTALTNDKVCGRALPSQLERTISKPIHPKKRLFWYWNYFVMFFMFFAKGNSAKAQGGIKPVTECSPLKGKSEVITVAGYAVRRTAQTIIGKVTDMDGNAVSFASVKVKGTNTGVSADVNGAYSLRVNLNAILVISGAGFIETEVPVGTQSALNTVLEKAFAGEMVVTVGLFSAGYDDVYSALDKKSIAVIKVRDVETDNALHNAKVIVTKNRKSDTAITDQKGTYRIKGIKKYDNYFIKVTADGYEPTEFTIDGRDFKDRKKEWEVLLKKQKVQSVKSSGLVVSGTEKPIRLMGGMFVDNKKTGALYVVDGIANPKTSVDITPDDIENITILQSAEATALYGIEGANGAIIITTRKAKEIKMKEVVVNSEYGTRRVLMGGMTGGITITNQGSHLNEIITTVKTILTDSIKVYPNPVPRNTAFSVALKLNQTGNYSMQITDASGRILLQQKINANSKDHTEKIMGDSRWAAGVYYIRVFDNKNQLISKTNFIFE